MKKVIKEEKMRADWARELVDYALAGSGRVQEEARILLTALGVPEGETARSGMEALAAKKMGSW